MPAASLSPGTLVRRGRRLGRVVGLDRTGRRALVKWDRTHNLAWNRTKNLRVVF